MRLSTIAYLVTLAATVIVRTPPIEKARGAEPRVSLLLGSFLITAVVLFPRRNLSPAEACVSTLLVLVGDSIAAVVLIQLRASFSIMAEARQLTTSGIYLLYATHFILPRKSRQSAASCNSCRSGRRCWSLCRSPAKFGE